MKVGNKQTKKKLILKKKKKKACNEAENAFLWVPTRFWG